MEKKLKVYSVVVGVSWDIPATSREEAIKKAEDEVGIRGFGYRIEKCEEAIEVHLTPKGNNLHKLIKY